VTPPAADLKPGGNNPNPSPNPTQSAVPDAGTGERQDSQDNDAAPDAVPRKSKGETPAKQASPQPKEPQL
jgi:hypothetical protein